MSKTKIEWCDRTWNPITGCPGPLASPGCVNCYARRTAETRLRGRCGYDVTDPFKVTFHPDRMKEPAEWKSPQRVFVGSMGDMFHSDVLFRDLDLVFSVAALLPRHEFMFLTKRVDLMLEYMIGERKNGDEGTTSGAVYDAAYSDRQWRYFADVPGWKTIRPYMPWQWPLPNVCLGATICNQKEAEEKIPLLMQIPAAKRFVSLEPLLEEVDLDAVSFKHSDGFFGSALRYHHLPHCRRKELQDGAVYPALDWVICGGETGPNARPMHPDWVRGLRDQCVEAGVSFFFKGWGEWAALDQVEFPSAHQNYSSKMFERFQAVYLFGRKRAGRLLDGVEYSEVPA